MNTTTPNSTTNSLEVFTQVFLEGLAEGVIILNQDQELISANTTGRYICQLLKATDGGLHPKIKHLCNLLIDSRELGDDVLELEDRIVTAKTTFLLRGQWLQLNPTPYLLLHLQDQTEMRKGQARAEAILWGLTSRETEVWVLRKSGASRKAIAAELYVAEDTVKKHLKNISTKQQASEEGRASELLLQAC